VNEAEQEGQSRVHLDVVEPEPFERPQFMLVLGHEPGTERGPAGSDLAFVVDDLEAELARLISEGVAITMPLREEPWGERAFQVTDPNGVIVQLVLRSA
jgi:uncharacterized glyoxalase superfamily protein PhnB